MYVLGIDTSTPTGSVGLVKDSEAVAEVTLNVSTTHSERLLESLDFVLSSCGLNLQDIDLFACAIGPGSFTGLRIGLAAVKGLVYAGDKKIVGVSSLDVLARNFNNPAFQICPMIDARKGEVYTAVYSSAKMGGFKTILKEQAISPQDLAGVIKKKTIFFGTGAELYADTIKRSLGNLAVLASGSFSLPKGVNVALLGLERFKKGKADDLDSLIPNYLRKSEAELHYKKK